MIDFNNSATNWNGGLLTVFPILNRSIEIIKTTKAGTEIVKAATLLTQIKLPKSLANSPNSLYMSARLWGL
jgi:hypothetical protein